ncbi:MAG: nucleotidyltransferase family protein [Anaerolineae bacterium]|nr:nucleotidyltransferase family protein [Anaerolineae bacterium]
MHHVISTPNFPITEDAQFLLACISVSMGLTPPQALSVDYQVDWQRFFDMAVFHQVIPLAYEAIKDRFIDQMPPHLNAEMSEFHTTAKFRSLMLKGELKKVRALFEQHHIAAMPIKGPLIAKLYDNPTLRSPGDLDISIPRQQIRAAVDLLCENGYTRNLDLSPAQEALWIASRQGYDLYNSQNSVAIDVHSDITSGRSPLILPLEDMVQHLTQVELDGDSIPNPSPEYFFLFLCIHETKHLWMHLKGLCDLAQFLHHYEDNLDWDWILTEARQRGGESMVLVNTYLAYYLLGAPVPSVIQSLWNEQTATIAEKVVSDRIFEDTLSTWETIRLKLQMIQGWHRRLDYIIRLIWIPQETNLPRLPVSARLYGVFYVMRPMQMLILALTRWGRNLFMRRNRAHLMPGGTFSDS